MFLFDVPNFRCLLFRDFSYLISFFEIVHFYFFVFRDFLFEIFRVEILRFEIRTAIHRDIIFLSEDSPFNSLQNCVTGFIIKCCNEKSWEGEHVTPNKCTFKQYYLSASFQDFNLATNNELNMPICSARHSVSSNKISNFCYA